MTNPNTDPIEAARTKQRNARAKMHDLYKRPARAATPNTGWHSQYVKRVAK